MPEFDAKMEAYLDLPLSFFSDWQPSIDCYEVMKTYTMKGIGVIAGDVKLG